MTIQTQAVLFFGLGFIVCVAGVVMGLAGLLHHGAALGVGFGTVGVAVNGWIVVRLWKAWRAGELGVGGHDENVT